MSWETILKKKFKFSDIDFRDDPRDKDGNYLSEIEVAPDLILSVIAGRDAYSTPRTKLSNPQDYEKYEFAFWDKQTKEWLTQKVLYAHDDVIPYKTKEEIEELVARAIVAWETILDNTKEMYEEIDAPTVSLENTDEFDEDFSSKYAMER